MTLVSMLAIAIATQTTQPAPAPATTTSAPAAGAQATQGAAVSGTIEVDAKSGQRIYRAQTGDCEVRWIIQLAQAENGAMRHYARCSLPVAQQTPLYEAVLDRVLKDNLALRTISWGRLDPDSVEPEHTLAMRLALAAKKSKEWNSKTGKGAKGNDNRAVKEIANQGQVFVELEKIFAQRDLRLEVRSIEKVLVQRAKKLPYFDQLEPEGVLPGDRLPFDAQVSFSVQKNEQR